MAGIVDIVAKQAGNDFFAAASDVKQVLVVDATLGVNSNVVNSLTIFPNPAKDQLTIETIGLCDDAQVNIFNTEGRIVKTEKISRNSQIVNIRNLSDGIYMESVSSVGNAIYQSKLVVARK